MNFPVPPPKLQGGAADLGVFPLAPSLERRRLQCYLALFLGDMLSFLAGAWAAGYVYLGSDGGGRAFVQAQIVLPVFLTVAVYSGAYSIAALRRPVVGIARAEMALLAASAFLIFFAFYTKTSTSFSRAFVTLFPAISASLILVTRWTMRHFVQWRCGVTVLNELVIDDGGPHIDFPGAIRVSAREFDLAPALDCPFTLDRIGLCLRNMDRVVVSCPPDRRAAWALALKGANIEGEVIDEAVAQLGAHGARVSGGQGLLRVSANSLGIRARAMKRGLDLGLAVSAVIVLSPLLALVALAVKLEDGGPVFFRQRRMGRGNRFFEIIKFRSMAVARADQDGAISASRGDARVTRTGHFIRRTSIDELPQLFNIIRGDMSLVGPRPHAIGSQAGEKLFWEVDLRYWQRHSLKPGLSGLAQIRGYRGATDHESDLVNRLQSDLEYLEGWTI
ncbi:MAG: sugar transferase [Novosphingobium sp.]|nr:sugar transferase [Novosphingobium sp.]